MDHDEDLTPEEARDAAILHREVAHASEDLADFLTWAAHQDEIGVDEFESISKAVYAYSRYHNPSLGG